MPNALPDIQLYAVRAMYGLLKRSVILRACRAGILLAALFLIHQQSEWRESLQPSSISLRLAQKFFPAADRVQLRDPDRGVHIVLNARREPIGALMKTLPFTEGIIGYAGPSDVLIALDSRGAVVGLEFLRSGDTHEHVRKVQNAKGFLSAFIGWRPGHGPAPEVDAVSGATLTSFAVVESVQRRLSGGTPSLRFPEPVSLEEVRAVLTNAARVTRVDARWQAQDASGRTLGYALRTSPQADNVPGYRGPTDSLIVLGPDGQTVTALRVRRSYDTLSYVDQVWRSEAFLRLFEGRSISQIASMELPKFPVDGVSGATLTARGVAEGVKLRALAETRARPVEASWRPSFRDWGLLAVILGAVAMAFTPLRGLRWMRLAWQAILIGYVGLVNHDFVSMALVGGWAANGLPFRRAPALVLLAAAALLVPWLTRRQVYCHQLCPHGAAQQWLGGIGARVRGYLGFRRLRAVRGARSWREGPKAHPVASALQSVPVLVLAAALLIVLLGREGILTSLEPFDAWAWRAAGVATVVIAAVGLVAALFVPQAYCRYGCPTGALLRYVRSSGSADVWGRRDTVALALLALGLLTVAWTRAFPPREPEPPPFECQGKFLTGKWSVKIKEEIADPPAIETAVTRQFEWAESMTSHWLTNSGIWEFNHTPSTSPIFVPWPVITLTRMAAEISREAGGAYDVTVGPLLRLWGIGSARATGAAPSRESLDAARLAIGLEKLEVGDGALSKQHPQLELDLSSLASGWAIDQVWQVVERRGYTNALIAANGVLRAAGPWSVALEPRGQCALTNEAFATVKAKGAVQGQTRASGAAVSAPMPLLLDARTGRPVEHRTLSVSLIHTNAARAQAWATALATLGADEGLPLADRLNLAARFVVQGAGRQLDAAESAEWRKRSEVR
ncbi:MAG: FAD:protein FMN transferase [Verrucomicrobiia bacterium]